MEMIDAYGLGGAMTLGLVQSGLKLVIRTGHVNLGAPVVEGNRPLLGWDWKSHFSDDPRDWPRANVQVLQGNPPCSQWSTLTRRDLRGSDAKAFDCTRKFIEYACLLENPPEIIALESVQQAFTVGRQSYVEFRQMLSEKHGKEYDLIWLMQSNASLGGASLRKRTFVVFSRVPFGVEYAQPARVARLGDAIRDLEGLALTPTTQPYVRPPTWWSLPRRAGRGVDGHFAPGVTRSYQELAETLVRANSPWRPGESLGDALRRCYGLLGAVPKPWEKDIQRLAARDFDLGLHQAIRWNADKQSVVITGAGPYQGVHYSENRLITHREAARIQGFPDTWMIEHAKNYPHLSKVWGKGVPVDAARWLGEWITRSLESHPGTVWGEPIGERERFVQITDAYRHTLINERPWEHQRWTASVHEPTEDYEEVYSSVI